MQKVKTIIHWISYSYYLYVFGYASLFKIFQKESMMEGMQQFGFNTTWTVIIGICEFSGVLLLLIGLFRHEYKNIGILFLFPFAAGAFTVHMAYHDYQYYYNSLIMCVLTVVLLMTDKHFSIKL